jgi:hypothetical protein
VPANNTVWQRYHDWYKAVLEHRTFAVTATDREDYANRLLEHYLPYSLADVQKDL